MKLMPSSEDGSGPLVREWDFVQITEVLSDYCTFADRRDVESLCRLFTPEGSIEVGSHKLEGPAAITAFLRPRFSPDRQTRHLWSNLRVETGAGNELRCASTQITFETVARTGISEIRIGDVSDVFRKLADGRWRIHKRVVQRAMSMATHSAGEQNTS